MRDAQARCASPALAALLMAILIASCHGEPTSPSTLAGSYVATEWHALVWAGRDVDVLAEGGSLRLELEPDGTSSGLLRFALGAEIDLEGHWEQHADTIFVLPALGSVPLLIHADQLRGRGLLGWFEVHYITLAREN